MSDDDGRLLEQYKMAAEMADRISARRGAANGFYFTVTSALLATSESLSLAAASGAGIALSAAWWMQLRSYRNLNAAKYVVINKLEERLPAKVFTDEWEILKRKSVERTVLRSKVLWRLGQPLSRYVELGVVEQVVPFVYLALFVVTLVHSLT
jgi:hypothetical protein